MFLTLTSCSNFSGPDSWFSEEKEKIKGERIKISSNTFYSEADKNYHNDNIIIPDAQKIYEITSSLGINSIIYPNILIDNISGLNLKQKFDFAHTKKFINITPPIFVDGKLIILEPNGILSAYKIKDGKKLWANQKLKKEDNPGFLTASPNFYQGGLYYDNQVVYFTSGTNSVLAVDSNNGKAIWSKDLASPARAVPALFGEMLFIQTLDNSTYALDAKSGNIVWAHYGIKTEVSTIGASSPIVKEGVVIVQYSTGEIIGLDASNGKEVFALGADYGISKLMPDSKFNAVIHQPILENEMLISYNNDGVLSNIDLSKGKELWKKDLDIYKPFWVCEELLIAINDAKELIALNKYDGRVKWRTDLSQFEDPKSKIKVVWSGPIIANSKVLVVNSQGKIFTFNINKGNKLSEKSVIKDVFTSPLIVDNKLYLISSNGKIAAYY